MDAKEMWREYSEKERITDEFDAWAFGSAADHLAQLVLSGEKTATSSAYPLYQIEEEPLPEAGEYSVILDSQDEAVCIIRTERVFIVPFDEVDSRHAYKEGEGDKSLAWWRKIHESFFTSCMMEAGLTFDMHMKVVCEEFVRVFP